MPAEVVTSENLAEYNAARMPQAVEVVEEVKDDPKPKAEAVETDDDEGDDEPAHKEEKPAKRKAGIEGRFSELSAKARAAGELADAATRRAEAAEARAKELEAKLAPKPKAEDTEPKASEFTDPFEYADKRSEWAVREALRNREKAENEAKAKAESEKTTKAWQERIAKAKADIPTFEDDLQSSDLAVSDDVRDAIIESDLGPQILHYLAVNPEVAEKLNGMNGKQALKEIGRLEVRLEPKAEKEADDEPKPRKRADLPEPIVPIKAKAANSSDGEGLSYAEYRAKRMAGKI